MRGTEPTPQEDIFCIDAATGAVRRLTDHSSGTPFVSDRDPAWSPNRDRIVFMSVQAVDPARLRVVSAAGAAVADLPVEGVAPAWIDSSTIVCGVFRAGPAGSMDRSDLVAVSLPGGQVRPLVTTASGEILSEPAWHPSGGLVVLLVVADTTTGAEVSRLVRASAGDVQGVVSGGPALTASALPEVAPGTCGRAALPRRRTVLVSPSRRHDPAPPWGPTACRCTRATSPSSPLRVVRCSGSPRHRHPLLQGDPRRFPVVLP